MGAPNADYAPGDRVVLNDDPNRQVGIVVRQHEFTRDVLVRWHNGCEWHADYIVEPEHAQIDGSGAQP